MSPLSSLPIDPLIPDILGALEKNNAVVVVAEPGAGKTTRIPPSFLSASFTQGKEIWVLQPRRLAAKLAAQRVAEELGEQTGQKVGYQFRFEKSVGPQTRLRFMTDGMLLPLAQSDPTLSKVAVVILDEFHERSLALELGLGWLQKLRSTSRPDLKLLVMSATLDAQNLSQYLSNCPVFKSSGRVFPVTTEYHPFPQEPYLDHKVKSALRALTGKGIKGTTLVFLPGLTEIKRCQTALQKDNLEVHALYGDLPVEEQQRILKPTGGNKVILSTNLAETSITVPGVTAVIDSGLTRQARVSPWSGLSSLVTVPASQASAAQRTGRAGRLQEGFCIRLYTQFDFSHRPAFDLPEISRADLSRSLLDLKTLGVENVDLFPWFLKPSSVTLESAHVLLVELNATTRAGELTETGRRMARFPLAPRLAKFLLEVEEKAPNDSGVLRQACRLAVLINEERAESADLLEELGKYKPGFESKRLEEQLLGLLKNTPPTTGHLSKQVDQEILAKSLLSAFPDRVAKIRPELKKELLLCGGGIAATQDNALTRGHDYFIVVEAQETGEGTRSQVKVRSICPIQEDWLLDLFPDKLTEEQTYQWNDKSKRVEGFRRLKYRLLVLDEKTLRPDEFGPEARDLLFKEALAAGTGAYCDPEELAAFLSRVKFVAEHDQGFPEISEGDVRETLKELCRGRRSLEDLKEAGLVENLRARLAPKDLAFLERTAPNQVTLAAGRKAALHYETGKPPWVESRIQDFFGMKKGPTVAEGRVPVVIHLLSPAKRPVQVTSDLEGFWKNHYPQIRKELSRRYPRHKWPENPV